MKKIIVDSIYLIAIPPSSINSGLCMTGCNISVFFVWITNLILIRYSVVGQSRRPRIEVTLSIIALSVLDQPFVSLCRILYFYYTLLWVCLDSTIIDRIALRAPLSIPAWISYQQNRD
jgi:hypothetical protein